MLGRGLLGAFSILFLLTGCSQKGDACNTLTEVEMSGVGTLEVQPERALVHYEQMGREFSDWLVVPPNLELGAPLDTMSGQKVLFEGLRLQAPPSCGYTGSFSQALRVTRLAVLSK